MKQNKKAMVQNLIPIALAIIGLIILVGVSIVVVTRLGDSTAVCPIGFDTAPGGYNATEQACMNNTASVTNTSDPSNAAWTATTYGVTQLGSTGLLSWLPAIIALIIGVFFLAYFSGKKKRGKSF